MIFQGTPINRDLNEAACPIPDSVFSTIHHATPQEALTISKLLPDVQRARLALFCYARGHLREAGCAIATACHDNDLIREGGAAGEALIGQRFVPKAGMRHKASKITLAKITLATPATQHIFATDDYTDEEDAA
jgi:hypothetical protein